MWSFPIIFQVLYTKIDSTCCFTAEQPLFNNNFGRFQILRLAKLTCLSLLVGCIDIFTVLTLKWPTDCAKIHRLNSHC